MANTLRRSFLMVLQVKKNLQGSTKYLQPALHGQLCQRQFSQNSIDFRYSDFTWHPRPVNVLEDRFYIREMYTCGEKKSKSRRIKEVFKNYNIQDDIDGFSKDKPEVYKVLTYIFNNNDVEVMTAQADTLEYKLITTNDSVIIPRNLKYKLDRRGIKFGAFSKAHHGENSEESRIIKAWEDLKNGAQIDDEKQTIHDFDEILLTIKRNKRGKIQAKKQWVCNILGCYISKYLETPRHALKVYEQLRKSVLYNSGKFDKKEDNLISQHIKLLNGEYDLNVLKSELNRPRNVIYRRIYETCLKGNLKPAKYEDVWSKKPRNAIYGKILDTCLKESPKAGQKFTLDEDVVIMKHVFKGRYGGKIEEKYIDYHLCREDKSWIELEFKLQRKSNSISQRYGNFICPTLLSHLYGTLDSTWKKEFFQYIIDKKYVSVTDFDYKELKEKWPSVSKRNFSETAMKFYSNNKKNGTPLHEHISENLHRLKPNRFSQKKMDLIKAFEKLRIFFEK